MLIITRIFVLATLYTRREQTLFPEEGHGVNTPDSCVCKGGLQFMKHSNKNIWH